jgi:hypothetical protein
MQTRLVGVAKELEVAIDDPEGAELAEPMKAAGSMKDAEPAPVADAVAEPIEAAAPAEVETPQDDAPDGLDGLENMLADDGLDMPGIPPLELDFDDDSDD